MIKLMLENKNTDVNLTDSLGVNPFWISCFKGQVEVRVFYFLKGLKTVKRELGKHLL